MEAALLAMILILGQAELPVQPGEIAKRHAGIMRRYDEDITAAKGFKEKVDLATASRDQQLLELMKVARIADYAAVSDHDYLVLAGAAQQLKRFDEATSFAFVVRGRSETFEPYVPLVMALCSLSRTDEAEDIANEAANRLPDAERRYLLPALLYMKYRSVDRFEEALGRLRDSIDLAVGQLEKSPFYGPHVGRCLDEFQELAARCHLEDYAKNVRQHWRARIADQCADKTWRLKHADKTCRCSRTDMVSVRLLHEALIQVDKRVDPTRTHEVAVSWLSAIASYGDIAPTESDWLDEASILAERIPALLLPAIDAKLIELHLEALLEKLSVDHAADAAPNAKKQRVRSLVKKSVGILKQHIRQMQLLGTSLAVKKPSETMDRTSHSSTLIRIIDPLSKNLRSEINQFGACEAQLTKAGVEPWLCCRQVGLTFDEATRSFGRSDDQTIEGEVNALDRLRGALKLHAPMRLLPMNSAIMRQLAPEFFPVNVLLGGDGTVIGVTTGAESDKILSLLVQAGPTTPSQGISDVATDGAQNLSFSR